MTRTTAAEVAHSGRESGTVPARPALLPSHDGARRAGADFPPSAAGIEILGSAPAGPTTEELEHARESAAIQVHKQQRCRELNAMCVLREPDTATHESTHALAAVELLRPILEITIEPERAGGFNGECHLANGIPIVEFVKRATESECWINLAILLSGPAGQALADDRHTWSQQSDRQALDIAARLYPHEAPAVACDRWFTRLQELIAEPPQLQAVKALAAVLREHETVSGADAETLLGAQLPDGAGAWLPILQRFHDEQLAARRVETT